MKKGCVLILSLLLIVMTAQSLWAKEAKRAAVLPFDVHSSEDIDYVRNGIWDMLISRVSSSGKIDVVNKNEINEALAQIGKKELTAADIYGLGKKLDLDYVVWGSITKIGNTVSLDGKLLDVSTYKMPVGIFEQCSGIDDVIPKISDFARKINYYILGETTSPVFAPSSPTEQKPGTIKADSETSKEPDAIDALKTEDGTLTSIINPSFITASSPVNRKGFWMSQKYSNKFKGMGIGDVNSDGMNEVVVIDGHSVMIYQKKNDEFRLLNKVSGNLYDNYLAVDVADINGNDIQEIIVTNINNKRLDSFVLEYDGKKYVRIASGLKWFLRIVDISGMPKLLGQKIGIDRPFNTPIYKIFWKGGKYTEGSRMAIPKGLSVFGLGIDNIEGSTVERIMALNEYDHLCVYRKTKKALSQIHVLGGSEDLIWKSAEVFGGTTNYFDYAKKMSGSFENDIPDNAYINMRILTYDINRDGKREVVIVKNISSIGRVLKNLKSFTQSEIYDLEWDGLGLVENWKTKRIQGYVADYQIKDIDNDGENEIVLIVRLSGTKSVIAAYDLNV
jgi:TolB-like protein